MAFQQRKSRYRQEPGVNLGRITGKEFPEQLPLGVVPERIPDERGLNTPAAQGDGGVGSLAADDLPFL